MEGERARIFCRQALDTIGDGNCLAIGRIEEEIEVRAGHVYLYSISMKDMGLSPALTTLCSVPASRR
ncbi:hypothetical protein D3C86_2247330 [compost metagenome]